MTTLKDALSTIRHDVKLKSVGEETHPPNRDDPSQPRSTREGASQKQADEQPSDEALFLAALGQVDVDVMKKKYDSSSDALLPQHDGQSRKASKKDTADAGDISISDKQMFLEAVGDVDRSQIKKKFE